ncbi:MAG: hypothetical protein ACI9RO_000658 [Alteromonas macleodii]|jgi:hypothetical protein
MCTFKSMAIGIRISEIILLSEKYNGHNNVRRNARMTLNAGLFRAVFFNIT